MVGSAIRRSAGIASRRFVALVAFGHSRSSISPFRFNPVGRAVQVAALFLRAAVAWAVMAAGKSSARTPWTFRGGVGSQRWLVIVFFTHKCRD